jgi:divalent metal cation (Fe/Co/Zn/Cd) transporter
VNDSTLHWVERAKRLAWFTLGYNLFEASISVWLGWQGRSLSLMGFGGDSLIEAASAAVVLWNFKEIFSDPSNPREKAGQRMIGVLLLALSLYLAVSSYFQFRSGNGPLSSLPGVWISLISLAVMGALYRFKKQCADALENPVLHADAFCTLSCMWLSGLLLLGSALLAGTHVMWFDSVTTLAMAVLIAREGIEEYDESRGLGHHDH